MIRLHIQRASIHPNIYFFSLKLGNAKEILKPHLANSSDMNLFNGNAKL